MGKRYGIQNPWIWIGGLIALGVIALFDPSRFGFFPQCPFHWLTGLQCPGCGSQRALHHLFHFEFGQAFLDNALLVLSLPYILAGIAFDTFDIRSTILLRWRKRLYGRTAIILVAVIVMIWWIGRNLMS